MRPNGPQLFRVEADVKDVEIEGKIPADLNGAFYRTGPDAQYPLAPGNIPFDGEGHVSMWRIKDGRVDYKSRFVRNERYIAQEKAHRILFPMYRNIHTDDPSVKGLSRSTANTHIINHKNMLLALKEDSPPVRAGPAHARDDRSRVHVRRSAAEQDLHRASEDRQRDRRHGRVRLRSEGLRHRRRERLPDHARGQDGAGRRGSRSRTSA